MASSDPKRSKEITTPRGTTASAVSEKPPKKIEPTVLVAVISAVVTLITAALSSPVLLALVKQDPTDLPASSEMGLIGTLIPGLPESSPTDELEKSKNEPTDIASGVESSPTLGQTNEPASTPEEVIAPTLPPATDQPPTPENTAIPIAPPTFLTCFAETLWFPYPATLNPGLSNGCWNLEEWGLLLTSGQVSLLHNPEQDQQRGVYLPLSGDVVIQFTFQLDEFRTRSNKGGFLHFGIVQDDPFSNYAGGFLSYQQPTPGATSPVRVLVSGTNQATETVLILDKGFQQAVVLSVLGDVLTVSLDGVPVGEPITLTPTKRAFWIGYVLPAKAELEAALTGLTIQTP